MKWRAVPETHFEARAFDDELVVYHIASGATHLLGEDAAEVFSSLRQQPQDAKTLAQSLAAARLVDLDEHLLEQTENILADLQSIELIEVTQS